MRNSWAKSTAQILVISSNLVHSMLNCCAASFVAALKWELVSAKGSRPPPLFGHSATALKVRFFFLSLVSQIVCFCVCLCIVLITNEEFNVRAWWINAVWIHFHERGREGIEINFITAEIKQSDVIIINIELFLNFFIEQ